MFLLSAVLFVVPSHRSKDIPRSPLTVPARCVACKAGLCVNPSSRVARLAVTALRMLTAHNFTRD